MAEESVALDGDSIFDLLSNIRKRPPMYLGKPSIYHLQCYLNGWTHGSPHGKRDCELFGEFVSYIEGRFGHNYTKGSQGWAKIIDFWSPDEIHALKIFFELLDEFQAAKKQRHQS